MRYTPYHQKQNNSDFQASALFYVMRSFWFLGGWGMFLNQSSGYRNYIQLSNNLWKHVTQDFNNNVRDEIKRTFNNQNNYFLFCRTL